MTDYNDGKWHGWNGGECPVDLEAEVEAIYMDGDDVSASSPMVDPAYAFDWAYENKFRLIAFRVTKPAAPKPREWWITTFDNMAWDDEQSALAHNQGFDKLAGSIIHVKPAPPKPREWLLARDGDRICVIYPPALTMHDELIHVVEKLP